MSGAMKSMNWVAAVAALAMSASAPAAAAVSSKASTPTYSPWVMMSAMASQGSASAMCAASASASAASMQGAAPGCVLPQVDAPVPVAQAPEAAPLDTAVVAPAAASGIGFLPILLGLAALAGVAALFLSNSDNNSRVRLPNSPV